MTSYHESSNGFDLFGFTCYSFVLYAYEWDIMINILYNEFY